MAAAIPTTSPAPAAKRRDCEAEVLLRHSGQPLSPSSFRDAPLGVGLSLVIPGRAPLREPGIHWAAMIAVGWIPGSRQERGAPRNDGGGMCVRIPAARCALVIPGSRGAPRNDEKRDLR